MYKLENKTLQAFLDNLVEALKDENESREWDNQYGDSKKQIFDIPFLVSSLGQAFKEKPDTYSDFTQCLSHTFY